MRKIFAFFCLLLLTTNMLAQNDPVEIGSYRYNLIAKGNIAEIVSASTTLAGEVVVPATVEYEGVTYTVNSINEGAFSSYGVTSLVLSEGLTTISSDAIKISSLKSITLPSTLVFLGESSIISNVEEFRINIKDLEKYLNINVTSGKGVGPFGYNTYKYSMYVDGVELQNLIVPSGVKVLGYGILKNCQSIQSITVPSSVEKIMSNAFNGCTNLKNLSVGEGLIIGEDVFSGCSNLSKLTFSGSIKEIGRSAFNDCKSLTSLDIPEGTSLSSYAFRGCSGLTSVKLPSNIEIIEDGLFSGCSSLTAITIPEKVTKIRFASFRDCTSLKKVTLGSKLSNIDSRAFANCKDMADVYCFSENVPDAYADTFEGSYPEYTTLHVPEAKIDAYKTKEPWSKFGKIEDLNTGESTTGQTKDNVEIGSYHYNLIGKGKIAEIVSASTTLSGEVVVPATVDYEGVTYRVNSINEGAFSSYGVTSLVLSEGLTTISSDAIKISSLKSITLPSTLVFLGESSIISNVEEFRINIKDLEKYLNINVTSGKGVGPFGYNTYKYSMYVDGVELQNLIVPSGVKVLGYGILKNCQSIQSITIPSSVEKIMSNAFNGCTNLKNLSIGEGLIIGEDVFSGCSNLSKLTFSGSIKEIGRSAFNDCKSLTSLDIPESTSLSSYAFSGCSGLTSVKLPSNIEIIENGLFSGCSSLTAITIPENVTKIRFASFRDCTSLKKVTLGSKLSNIDSRAFANCKDMADVYCFSENVPDAYADAFEGSYPECITLHVPEGCVEAYNAVAPWSGFKEIVETPSSAPVSVKDGMSTYVAPENLDFSKTDEVKAYVVTGYDYDSKTVWMTRVKDVPAGEPIILKGTATAVLDIPVKMTSGSYYKNMLVANTTGGTIYPPATTGDMTNYYLSSGIFKTSTGTNPINPGKCYLQIPTAEPAPTVGSGQKVKMNGDGYATLGATQDLDFTEVAGLKALAATGYDDADGTVWLTRVMRASAGTGLLLQGEAGKEYNVPSSAVKSYYANMMVGNTGNETIYLDPTDGEMRNYYFRGKLFLKAAGGNPINPGKAYMQIPSAHVTRSVDDDPTENLSVYDLLEQPEVIPMQVMTRGFGGDDDTTGIREAVQPEQTNDVYYNLNGQRVENPGKGLYIYNGRKVVIK